MATSGPAKATCSRIVEASTRAQDAGCRSEVRRWAAAARSKGTVSMMEPSHECWCRAAVERTVESGVASSGKLRRNLTRAGIRRVKLSRGCMNPPTFAHGQERECSEKERCQGEISRAGLRAIGAGGSRRVPRESGALRKKRKKVPVGGWARASHHTAAGVVIG